MPDSRSTSKTDAIAALKREVVMQRENIRTLAEMGDVVAADGLHAVIEDLESVIAILAGEDERVEIAVATIEYGPQL